MRGYFDIAVRLGWPFAVIASVWIFKTGKTVVRRWGTGSARGWPTMAATIDVVSVAEQIKEGRYDSVETTGFTATLTYFYRNPELQMGEYSKVFPLEAAAKKWAESFKGKGLLVHVNPKDPSDSVLLEEDLNGLESRAQPSMEEFVRMEGMPQLKSGLLLLSGTAEIVSLTGLGLTALALVMHRARGTPVWLICVLAGMLVFGFTADWIVHYRTNESAEYRAFLHHSIQFSPAWMRWGVKLTGGMLFVAWILSDLKSEFPAGAQHWIVVNAHYWPFLIAFWGFLSSGAKHAAILRSQEWSRGAADGEIVGDAGRN